MKSKEVLSRPDYKEVSEREFFQELFEQKMQLITLLQSATDDNQVKAIESMIESLNLTRDIITEGQETHYYSFFMEGDNLGYKAHRKPELGFRK